MLELSSNIKRSDTVVQTEIDGEVVMMNIDNGEYYGLDTIASYIWTLIDSSKTVDQICKTLLTEYDVTEEQCNNDVIYFLNDMAEKNIIVVG